MNKGEGKMIQTIKRAISKENEYFLIIYLAPEGTITQRKIKILKVKEEKVIAYCYLRKGVRTFQLEQILGLEEVADVKARVI